MLTVRERNLSIVNQYIASGELWPAEPRTIAKWALNKGAWQPPLETLVSQAAEEFTDAMRNEYFIDGKGRRARVKHAARVKRDGKQITLWGDWNSSPQFMAISFAQRRRLVVGECDQLKTDVDSYNEFGNKAEPIQMNFNFEFDLAEREAVRQIFKKSIESKTA